MKTIIAFVTAVLISFGFAGATFAAEKTEANPFAKVAQVSEKVNINSADAEALANTLHRVGMKKAEAIIAWRDANGKFTSVEQLTEVKGIGDAIVAANKDRVTL